MAPAAPPGKPRRKYSINTPCNLIFDFVPADSNASTGTDPCGQDRQECIPVDSVRKVADYLFKSESFRTSGLMKAKRLLMQQEG